MAYVDLVAEGSDMLHFRRRPTRRSWIALAFWTAFVSWAPYLLGTPLYAHVVISAVGVMACLQFLEPVRECIIRKDRTEVRESNPITQHLQRKWVYDGELTDVLLHTESLRYVKPAGHLVALTQGLMTVHITTTCTLDDISAHRAVAEKIADKFSVPITEEVEEDAARPSEAMRQAKARPKKD
eukprot:m.133643 g.133643  ORF g.133643 m.133643 type:complete len:183 (+) comp16518_c0_seq2:574-1122(+)